MMLADVIKLDDPPVFAGMDSKPKEALQLLEALEYQHTYEKYAKQCDDEGVFPAVQKIMMQRLSELRSELFKEKGCLAQNVTFGETDPYHIASGSPRVELAELRRVVNLLHYSIIPHELVTDDAFEDISLLAQHAVTKFVEYRPSHYELHVVCPIHYYSVKKHIEAEGDLFPYVCPLHEVAFAAIDMMIPLFRSIKDELANRAVHIPLAQERLDKLKMEFDNLQSRVSALGDIATRQRPGEIKKSFLLVGMPAFDDWNTDQTCLMGPSWGLDTAPEEFAKSGLFLVDGQQKRLTLLREQWSRAEDFSAE